MNSNQAGCLFAALMLVVVWVLVNLALKFAS
jgi:hypothetical protein